jgi:putative phosphoribosyl transferase
MKSNHSNSPVISPDITISADDVDLYGELEVPGGAQGVVLFAHGSGSSRHSPRNQHVARILREAGIGTLLFDLLTHDEEQEDEDTGVFRFDIKLLAKRLLGATLWLEDQPEADGLKIGYFGSSTGGGAALMAAAALGERIAAVVSRGGRPDLAGEALPNVKSPTLLVVGGLDDVVIQLNEQALEKLRCEKQLRIVPGATHLFAEHGKLEEVAHISAEWFHDHLAKDDNGEKRDE